MKKAILLALMGVCFVSAPALAQQKTVTGKVTDDQGAPLASVRILIKGTSQATQTDPGGAYSISALPGQVLRFSFIGYAAIERTVGAADVIDVTLRPAAVNLEAVEVTALGQTVARRTLGTSQQTVQGPAIAQTQRPNFLNALAGRVAGLNVTSSSGVPGASTLLTIRGVSSISSSNQPLIIMDGLPVDNSTLATVAFASDRPNTSTSFDNRGVDFTNRAADFNPEDIESITVLKGPEAAALYGIDAANGAIVITTKRGRAGTGGLEYSNNVQVASINKYPEIQKVYGPSGLGGDSYLYFGDRYAPGTQFYNNVQGFFRTAVKQTHNLAFSGATQDNRVNYRISTSLTRQNGIVPNTKYNRINVTGSSQAQVTNWLSTDVVMQYVYDDNNQPLRGSAAGPLLGLLVWPDTDNAKEWLTPAGTRRRLTTLSEGSELDNPYFAVYKNRNSNKTNRVNVNVGVSIAPVSWGYLKSNIGVDTYTSSDQLLRHPESTLGFSNQGIIDQSDVLTRNVNAQTILNFNRHDLTSNLSISGFIGNAITDNRATADGVEGLGFLDPNFVSVNNVNLQAATSNLTRRRLVSAFGSATLNYRDYLYITGTGRNDWTSTIPKERNSFFYPSLSGSFVFSDAFPSVGRFMTGRVRAAYAEVGRDAQPYAYRPSLLNRTTSYGGYSYNFWGPNLNLRPEFARSYEVGTELGFLDDRLGLDVALYRKTTRDQIVQNIRGSYGTGFILFNLNGATTRNQGLEVTLRGTPVLGRDFSWELTTNFAAARGKLLSLPHDLPESYNSDTWLYGNVRNGTMPGLSTMSITGRFYQRVTTDSAGLKGALLIDPTTGLPLRTAGFVDAGYDRQPDFTIGIGNTFRYKKFSLNVLIDIRKGGDVFNATQHYLTVRGLSTRTLDREQPRVVKGVLRDGNENGPNPTINTIEVTPSIQTDYYRNISEEEFIEKNINWLRLRDVNLSYQLPADKILHARTASIFFEGTDLLLWTNYTGLDPIVNGNTAAVGGSSGVGFDFGNFPIPRTFSLGLKVGF